MTFKRIRSSIAVGIASRLSQAKAELDPNGARWQGPKLGRGDGREKAGRGIFHCLQESVQLCRKQFESRSRKKKNRFLEMLSLLNPLACCLKQRLRSWPRAPCRSSTIFWGRRQLVRGLRRERALRRGKTRVFLLDRLWSPFLSHAAFGFRGSLLVSAVCKTIP